MTVTVIIPLVSITTAIPVAAIITVPTVPTVASVIPVISLLPIIAFTSLLSVRRCRLLITLSDIVGVEQRRLDVSPVLGGSQGRIEAAQRRRVGTGRRRVIGHCWRR